MEWKKEYSVQVSDFDLQHKKTLDIISNLFESMKQGRANSQAVTGIITELGDYVKSHFKEEEKYFIMYNYPYLKEQMREHRIFIDKINKIQDEVNSGKLTMSIELMSFLKDWWSGHINEMDKKYGPYFNKLGIS
jgi:hemerythrin-like metal-binding protein